MSSVLAAVAHPSPRDEVRSVARMILAMADRGDEWRSVAEVPPATLANIGYHWERVPSPSQRPKAAATDAVYCVADSRLVFREQLVRRLRVDPGAQDGMSDADMICAAYRALGDECVNVLEGDFAFIVWDVPRARLFAARDFVGQRTLHYFGTPELLVVASTVAGVVAHESVPRRVDMDTVAESAACLSRHSARTCFQGVSELLAGHTLSWELGARPRTTRFWHFMRGTLERNGGLVDRAAQLRTLLEDSVSQRMDVTSPTAINLSGGYDSPAVYGVGQSVAARAGAGSHGLAAVSMSYPVGDPGREDETISEIVGHWGGSVAWQDVESVDLFAADEGAVAATRDEAVGHHFENWNRALFRRAREQGARVVFTGAGGDQLFHVSRVYLADLVRRGQLLEAMRQWRLRGAGGPRDFVKFALAPLVPQRIYRALARVGGPRIGPRFDREPPSYFAPAYVEANDLRRRDARERPRFATGSLMDEEMHALLIFPMVARTMGRLFETGLSCGVEIQHPLLDERVVRFAMESPWSEKANGAETKIVLRQAAAGLLPEKVLAARRRRTGESAAWFVRQMQGPGLVLARSLAAESALADSGMTDPALLQLAWQYFGRTGDRELAFQLYHTLQAELWLRHHQ